MRLLIAWCLIAVAFAGCAVNDGSPSDPGTPDEPGDGDTPLRQVDFSWDLDEPAPGQVMAFEAHAPGAAAFAWDFGDGSDGSGVHVTHVYDARGVYEVRLTASYEEGPDASRSRILNVGDSAAADPDGPEVPGRDPPVIRWEQSELTLRFSFDFAGEADAVGWDFGDGGTSNDLAPEHAYRAPGTYEVRLSILEGETFYKVSQQVEVDTDMPTFRLADVGRAGAEPTIGVMSDGCIFFMAGARVMRSCDDGDTWSDTGDLLSDPAGVTFDPWLWVDPVVDRVWSVNMLGVECSWIAWSDDGGDSWLANPWNCGAVPGNDHIKLASGPWPDGSLLADAATFDRAVYYCVNKVPPGSTATAVAAGIAVNTGVNCAISLDGGATFPIQRQATVLGTGLHGAIEVAPDGTVYVPPRFAQPTVLVSRDAGLTWSEQSMGGDVGTPDPRKNSEVATDTDSNAYHVWISSKYGVYLARSINDGPWDRQSIRVSPDHVTSATFAHIDAGDPGRIAVAYLGSEDHAGNPHDAPADATYHLYVTFSLNALADDPQFTTVRVTDDPVQAGSICINSADCTGGNRNLLDFNDLHIGPDGRVYVAFADGCTGGCARDPSPGSSRDAAGTVAILESGPSLYADVGRLAPLG